METFYLLESGAYLKKDGETLAVVKNGRAFDRIPAASLNKLILAGYVSLSGGVLDFLIKNRIETVFMTPTGRYRARLMIDEHKHVELRRAQYIRLSDPKVSIPLMRRITCAKIENMATLCRKRGNDYKSEELKATSARLKALKARLRDGNDPDVIRGIEGAASRIYFSTFSILIRNRKFSFQGRNRRPPRDPVNALLSFAYTMLTNEVLSAIKACGLDPYFGALHEVSYGRPSLACDLVEEYRVHLADRYVLGLLNRKMITPDDFAYNYTCLARKDIPVDEKEIQARRPVVMKPETCRAFIAGYENMMKRTIYWEPAGQNLTYRRLILFQARRFAESLLDPSIPYEPFTP